MTDRLTPPCIHVKDTGTSKGRGVYASRAFRKGEIIEVCPVVVVRGSFNALPAELQTLVYGWHLLAREPRTHAVALGYGSLYNSANPANMRFEADAAAAALRFIADRDILQDEELTINYSSWGGAAQSTTNDWFKRLKVRFLTER